MTFSTMPQFYSMCHSKSTSGWTVKGNKASYRWISMCQLQVVVKKETFKRHLALHYSNNFVTITGCVIMACIYQEWKCWCKIIRKAPLAISFHNVLHRETGLWSCAPAESMKENITNIISHHKSMFHPAFVSAVELCSVQCAVQWWSWGDTVRP